MKANLVEGRLEKVPQISALIAAEVFSNYLALMAVANTHRALKGYQNTICGPAAPISRAWIDPMH